MAGANEFAKMVPGFDFLQGLLKTAGAGLPGMGQWVAPTLDPDELDKRIQELKTVQFWLEQNARLLATTIQALEVQRMTLSTLRSMNLPLADLGQALQARVPAAPPEPAPAVPSWAGAEPEADAGPAADDGSEPAAHTADSADSADNAPAAVDPLQWWGALTQQFTQIATQALKDSPAVGSVAQHGLEAMRSALGQVSGASGAQPAPGAAAAPRPASRTRAKPAGQRAAGKPSETASARTTGAKHAAPRTPPSKTAKAGGRTR